MPYTWTTNQTPATGAVAVFNLKTLLKTVGWTVPSSSDGTTYNSSGDQITTGSSGAGGMANNSAWFRIKSPTGNRELIIQRGTSNPNYRIMYSAAAGFSGGSPAATQTPSATDEEFILGGGTHAVPTFVAWFSTDNSYRQQIGANSTADYPFWMVCYPNGGGSPNAGFLWDPILNSVPGDNDALVIYIGVTGTTVFESGTIGGVSTNSLARGWLKKGLSGEDFVIIPGNHYTSGGGGTLAPSSAATNPHTGKDDEFPVLYGRSTSLAAPQGFKGVSSIIRWRGTLRTTGDTATVVTTKDRFIAAHISLPWDGSTTPLI